MERHARRELGGVYQQTALELMLLVLTTTTGPSFAFPRARRNPTPSPFFFFFVVTFIPIFGLKRVCDAA